MSSTAGHGALIATGRRRHECRDPFFWLAVASSAVIVAFILVPLVEMMTQPTVAALKETLLNRDVIRSIRLSMVTSGAAAGISLVFGTPLAYLLARHRFPGKKYWKVLSICSS